MYWADGEAGEASGGDAATPVTARSGVSGATASGSHGVGAVLLHIAGSIVASKPPATSRLMNVQAAPASSSASSPATAAAAGGGGGSSR